MSFGKLLEDSRVLVIAEIGINHDGSVDIARKLISAASAAGVHAIKFQYRNIENAYISTNEIGDEIISAEIVRNHLTPVEILELRDFASGLGLLVGISFFEINDTLDFKSNIEIFDFFKIPSVEHDNLELISYLLSLKKYLLIATGTASEESLVKTFSNIKSENWSPLHCVSNYPVAPYNAKLGYLKFLGRKWNRPIGYSSHDANWSVVIASIIMGARIIERHITLNKKSVGLDHSSSSTPEEFAFILDFSENFESIIDGDFERIPNQGELLNLQNLGRGFYAKNDLEVGIIPNRSDFLYRSPRVGLNSKELNQVLNKPIVNRVAKSEPVTRTSFLKRTKINEKVIDFANKTKLALPVRIHDYHSMVENFQIDNYEFHLSFGEISQISEEFRVRQSDKFTVHLPDYCSPTQLMNPFAEELETRKLTKDVLDKTFEFVAKLEEQTQEEVKVVGSFSAIPGNEMDFYKNYSRFIDELNIMNRKLVLQWLPPVAWYFGGSVKLKVMNNPNAVERILDEQIPIVMDTSHLLMGVNHYDLPLLQTIERLEGLTHWYHISGASGIDGEGTSFESMNRKENQVFKKILDSSKTAVIEVWQGHLDQYYGFQIALETLEWNFNE